MIVFMLLLTVLILMANRGLAGLCSSLPRSYALTVLLLEASCSHHPANADGSTSLSRDSLSHKIAPKILSGPILSRFGVRSFPSFPSQ